MVMHGGRVYRALLGLLGCSGLCWGKELCRGWWARLLGAAAYCSVVYNKESESLMQCIGLYPE